MKTIAIVVLCLVLFAVPSYAGPLEEGARAAETAISANSAAIRELRDEIEALRDLIETEPPPPTGQPFWHDDFSGTWWKRFPLKYYDKVGLAERVEHFGRDEQTWIRVTYPEGIAGKGFKFRTEHDSRERMYLEYEVRFAGDFEWVKGGKLPGLYGGKGNTGRNPPDGTDGWSVRFMWGGGGKGIAYVYHPDQPKPHGEAFSLGNFQFSKGVQHTIGLEVIMNTPRQRDGIIRAWLDGALVVEETGIRFRDIADLQVDGLAFSTIFGGSSDAWAPVKDETIEFGNFRLYDQRE